MKKKTTMMMLAGLGVGACAVSMMRNNNERGKLKGMADDSLEERSIYK
ncbi:hypothetical protein EV207_11129 [Scopulibacillus darangshiensis]|uniref:Lipoprotein n=1 Tax=Scopulibacillus darangshiensis TaxID=442528 RepID=A0A4R2P383_9BACL|nr:hypothetical protein [Scopulibacillus darangshiensis]TCP29229.1 hypothetical protein EV207_11129 [Scopulibacillus darangshiensis]